MSTTDLTRAFGWDSFEAFQQQDVQVRGEGDLGVHSIVHHDCAGHDGWV